MKIEIIRVPSVSTKPKQILMVNDKPVVVCRGNKSINEMIGYLMNGAPVPSDHKIKRALDKAKGVTLLD